MKCGFFGGPELETFNQTELFCVVAMYHTIHLCNIRDSYIKVEFFFNQYWGLQNKPNKYTFLGHCSSALMYVCEILNIDRTVSEIWELMAHNTQCRRKYAKRTKTVCSDTGYIFVHDLENMRSMSR